MVFVSRDNTRIILNLIDLKKLIFEPTTLKNHFQNIFIVGREGLTKSTLAFILSKYFSGKSYKEVFDRFLILKGMGNDEIQKRLNDADVKINIFDEFIKNAYNKEHYKQQAIDLVKTWVESRSLRKVSFLLIPTKKLALKYFRDGGALYMFKMVSMGVAVLFKFDDDNEKDGWNEHANAKIYYRYISCKFSNINDIPLDYRLWVYSQYVNYVGEFHFDAIPDEDYKYYYDNYKTKYRFDYGEPEKPTKKDALMIKRLVTLISYLRDVKGLTYVELSKILDWDNKNVNNFVLKYKDLIIEPIK